MRATDDPKDIASIALMVHGPMSEPRSRNLATTVIAALEQAGYDVVKRIDWNTGGFTDEQIEEMRARHESITHAMEKDKKSPPRRTGTG